MQKTIVWLARHGEVEGSGEGRFNGHNDVPLSARGEAEMRWVAEHIAGEGVVRIYTSDLARAQSSAAVLAKALDAPVETRPALRELSHGACDGMTLDEVRAAYPGFWERFLASPDDTRWPEGESFADLRDRVAPELKAITERHEGEQVAVVAHLGVCRVVLGKILGLDAEGFRRIDLGYGSLSRIERRTEGTFVTLMGHREMFHPPAEGAQA